MFQFSLVFYVKWWDQFANFIYVLCCMIYQLWITSCDLRIMIYKLCCMIYVLFCMIYLPNFFSGQVCCCLFSTWWEMGPGLIKNSVFGDLYLQDVFLNPVFKYICLFDLDSIEKFFDFFFRFFLNDMVVFIFFIFFVSRPFHRKLVKKISKKNQQKKKKKKNT